MNNVIDINTELKKDKPWVVTFRTDWHKVTPEISKVALAHCPLFQLSVAENWHDLAAAMPLKPALVVFHYSAIDESKISVTEFVGVITTICKTFPGSKPRVAVSIDVDCTPSMLKELKAADIMGIVPAVLSFGVDATLLSIETMLAGKQSWPKEVIDSILQSKKEPKKVSHNIHLTTRQKQVMDLVCHRGLPNKTIANMLHITESTVKIHVSAILKEYGVRNRTQLALAARDALHD